LVRDQDNFQHFAPRSDAIEPIPVSLLPNKSGSVHLKHRRLQRTGTRDNPTGSRDPKKFQKINSVVDPILITRLDTLQQKLSRIPTWLETELQALNTNQETQRMLKTQLTNKLNGSVSAQLGALDAVYNNLNQSHAVGEEDLRAAWRRYIEINSESQKIFLEYVDLMSGLAIRDKELDSRICWIADELVMQCAVDYTFTADLISLTVLAQQEALNRSMARILRLRFPEWTVWSLPLIAHEFGHVLIEDHPDLEDFAATQLKVWNRKRKSNRARKQNESFLAEVIADAFATYMVGPAYACAAISLRLNPSIINSEEMRLADATRVTVILSVLRWMNDTTPNPNGRALTPYKEMITRLEEQWNHALQRAKPSGALSKEQKAINTLIDDTLEQSLVKIRTIFFNGRYPSTGSSGLEVARNWAQDWSEQLAASKKRLSIPRVPSDSSLRDVLNAAWICRIESEASESESIAEAAYRLCERIAGRLGSAHDPGSGMHETRNPEPPRRPPGSG
jgi:hypothetical protein